MSLSDTIAAIASPPGRSARAIIRISGPATFGLFGSALVSRPTSRASPSRLHLTDSLALPCLLLTFRAPHSYTGEDSAEIQIPGNPILAGRVLARLLSHPGLRLANPGEFTARACLNGKLSVQEGEGVGALVAARTDEELAAARELSSGRTGALHRRWADEVTTLLALVEAGIDFTDHEDVVAISPASLAARLRDVASAMRAHLGSAAGAEAMDEQPRVVLAGAPNAGKSTLFNALLRRRRAVESPEAGTTRDALRETLDLSRDLPGAGPVTLIDLAGLSVADASGPSIPAAAQTIARAEIAAADIIIHCDPAGRFPPLQAPPRTPIIRARTKADLAPSALPTSDIPHPTSDIPICSLDGWNLPALRRAIADASLASSSGAHATVPARHRRAISAALAAVDAAAGLSPRSASQPELVAGCLREALEPLSELVGRISADDVLARVFATFCVGK